MGNPSGGTVGTTGGSDTHNHTDNTVSHTHTQDAFSTTHKHANTDSIGNHQHGTITMGSGTVFVQNLDTSAGAHSHTYNNDAWTHTHAIDSSR